MPVRKNKVPVKIPVADIKTGGGKLPIEPTSERGKRRTQRKKGH